MGSSTAVYGNFWIQISSPENMILFVAQNLLERSFFVVVVFFAYLPSIAGYIARSCYLERKVARF